MTNLKNTLIGRIAACALFILAGPALAAAQTYPTHGVTIVVGSQPGGTTDLLARILAKGFSTAWGKPVVVENKVGANNQIAGDFVGRAAPDGYTLWVTPDSFVTNPLLNNKLSHDSFDPISGLARAHHALVASPSFPPNSVPELIAYAKSHSGQISYGTSGLASAGHLSMEYLLSLTGLKFTAVHYKGATPAYND
ncbi:MAG TPA: tripartite tricarboxylate transporter substrate binding protein, partial [Acetobacteraceae bacterium]|nr:tripartite tricarboxylate transporter substrate binding protein [Acetobacteraceae bacterium]